MPQNEYEQAYNADNSHLRPAHEPSQFDNADQARGYMDGAANRKYWNNVTSNNGQGFVIDTTPIANLLRFAIVLSVALLGWLLLYPTATLADFAALTAGGYVIKLGGLPRQYRLAALIIAIIFAVIVVRRGPVHRGDPLAGRFARTSVFSVPTPYVATLVVVPAAFVWLGHRRKKKF